MITINLEATLAILSILGIAAGAVLFMVRLWNKVDGSLTKHGFVLESLVETVAELKGYDKRITKNEKDIALIQQRCDLIHEDDEVKE